MAVTFNAPPALARVAAATAVVTTLLTQGAIFTINKVTGTLALRQQDVLIAKSSSGSGVASDGFGNLRLSGSLIAFDGASNEVSISSGSSLRYPVFPLTGSGVSTATGTNVFGDIVAPYAFTLRTVNARISEAADDNATTVIVLKNGKTVLSTNASIDATEKDTSTGTAGVVNSASGSFAAGDILTFNVQSPATTPGKDLKVRLSLLQTSFP